MTWWKNNLQDHDELASAAIDYLPTVPLTKETKC